MMTKKDLERLEKLRRLLDFKVKARSNPVEVGIDDFRWMVEKLEIYARREEPPKLF